MPERSFTGPDGEKWTVEERRIGVSSSIEPPPWVWDLTFRHTESGREVSVTAAKSSSEMIPDELRTALSAALRETR